MLNITRQDIVTLLTDELNARYQELKTQRSNLERPEKPAEGPSPDRSFHDTVPINVLEETVRDWPKESQLLKLIVVDSPEDGLEYIVLLDGISPGTLCLDRVTLTFVSNGAPAYKELDSCKVGDLTRLGVIRNILALRK